MKPENKQIVSCCGCSWCFFKINEGRKTCFQKDRKLKVWSVQLLLSRDKYLATRKVVEVKKITKNITSKVDWFYQAPYYRIYAGAFYTKLEAATLLDLLLDDFPDAIVFKNTEARPSDM